MTKKVEHTLSDKYAIIMYLLLIVMSTIMLFDSSFMSLVQQQYIVLYKVIVSSLVLTSLLSMICACRRKYTCERTWLCFLIVISVMLLIEKSVVFWIYSPLRAPSDYILYASLTIFKLTFACYRYARTRKKIKEQQLHSDAVSEYREMIQGRNLI